MESTRRACGFAAQRFAKSLFVIAMTLLLCAFHAPAHGATDLKVRISELTSPFTVSGMELRYPGSSLRKPNPFQALRISWKKDSSAQSALVLWRIEDRDTGSVLAEVHAKQIAIEGFSLRLNLKPVPSRLILSAAKSAKTNHVDLIAQMEMEEYLSGVLPSEMPSSWPIEALKAQAVAARTYALYRKEMRERVGASFHLESTVMDQVFFTPPPGEVSQDVVRALSETKGVVLRDLMKRPFAAYFHADCGGRTEEAAKIWGSGGPQLGTAVDDGCPLNPLAKWRAQLSLSEMGERLRKIAAVPAQLALNELDVGERSESGRIDSLSLRWGTEKPVHISGQQFRMAMGFNLIRSTNFEIKRTAIGAQAAYEFTGKGYGHGVGLCQWGARHMALNGSGFKEILRHYYPRALISTLTLAPGQTKLERDLAQQ